MSEETYGTDRVSRNDWWGPPARSYTPEEIELLREVLDEIAAHMLVHDLIDRAAGDTEQAKSCRRELARRETEGSDK